VQQKVADVPKAPPGREISGGTTPEPAPEPAPDPSLSASPTHAGKPGMGETCGVHDACAAGLTCITYYGIAGARGPAFKSCEIRCDTSPKAACPKGTSCMTVSDGPGRVCR